MQDRVRSINKTIQASEDQGNLSRAKLASMVTQVDLDRCSNFIENVRMERFKQVKNRQVRKLHILCSKNNKEHLPNINNNIKWFWHLPLLAIPSAIIHNIMDKNIFPYTLGCIKICRENIFFRLEEVHSSEQKLVSLQNQISCYWETIYYSKEQANNNRDSDNRFPLGVNANGTDSNRQALRHGNDKQTSNSNINSKWVINLCKTELTQAQKSVLSMGPNYAVSPNNIPNLDYITAIETVCSKLKEEDVAELRGEINGILSKTKTPKPNLNKEERIALNQLRKDRVILTANKGVAMVVLDKEDCNNKARDLLNTPAYKEIPKDPTNRIKTQLITKLRKIKKDSKLDEGTYRTMYPTGCVLPKFYGLPQIHKTGTPLGQLSLTGIQSPMG